MNITAIAKGKHASDIAKYWPELAAKYGIRDKDTPYMLAQIAAETGGFSRLEESLNYTTVARLRAVWPKRFPSDAAAAPYVRQPKKLANLVYGGRLGNTGPNDGWLYRGSGCKQTTGKTNFAAVERATGQPVVANPELLRSFPLALESAMIYWRDNNLGKIVDAGGDIVTKLTKAIQGGSGGLADRRMYTTRALAAFDAPAPAATPTLTADTVTKVQTQLKALGYTEVGEVDGKVGKMTRTAILAFRNENDLPLVAEIDDDLLAALWTAKPRTLAPSRVDAPTAVIREQVPEAKAAAQSQLGAWVLGVPAAIGTVVTGVLDNLDGARGYLEPLKQFASDVPVWAVFATVAGAAFFIWQRSQKAEQAASDAFKTGERR